MAGTGEEPVIEIPSNAIPHVNWIQYMHLRSVFALSAVAISYALVGSWLDLIFNVVFLVCFNPFALETSLHLDLPYISVLALGLAVAAVGYFALACRGRQASRWQGPGKPYLLPCRTTHRRFFPEKHSFSYSYLAVGVPVGFEGSANGMIEIDEQSSSPSGSKARLSSQSWYCVHAADHLQREHHDLGLRGKLDDYLQCEGVNPEDFPHVYLVTAARFAGYHFNPVSFWYLYSKEKMLSAMILEVNNTFDERRPYLVMRDFNTEPDTTLPGRTPRIRASRNKDFHVSPFNSREGHYTVMAKDSLAPGMDGVCDIDVTITLNSSDGRPKLVARLFSEGQAVDPTALGPLSKLWFLLRWFWVGFVTLPRIVKEAFVLLFRRKLKIWDRPEPQQETLGRHPTDVEKVLETCFQRYLAFLVSQSGRPLVVRFYASGLRSEVATTYTSAVAKDSQEIETLTVRVLTPAFYSRFIRHEDGLKAARAECSENGTISVDKPELLTDIFVETIFTPAMPGSMRWKDFMLASLAMLLGPRSMSSIDAYMILYEDGALKRQYQWATVQQLIADRFFMGRLELIKLVWNLVRIGIAWTCASSLTHIIRLASEN